MERRKALAAASTATLILGSTIVAAASMTGASFLGFGGGSHGKTASAAASTSKPGTIVKTRNIYDQYVVDTGTGARDGASAGGRASAGRGAIPSSGGTTVPNSGPDIDDDDTTPTSKPKGSPSAPGKQPAATTPTTEPGESFTPTTVAPAPSPTTIPTTTTTWPQGVPRDWPKDKPIPPMPPDCEKPQLEDNGVWNCEH